MSPIRLLVEPKNHCLQGGGQYWLASYEWRHHDKNISAAGRNGS